MSLQVIYNVETDDRVFDVSFRRVVLDPVTVTITSGAKVILSNGVPYVQMRDDNPGSPTRGMLLMLDLQAACARGLATWKPRQGDSLVYPGRAE